MAAVVGAVAAAGQAVQNIAASVILTPEEARRQPYQRPGHLVYSAEMDQEKLECFYGWCCCMCCAKQTMAQRSVVDVYTNGIMTNVPCGMLCCCWQDRTQYLYWDDARFTGVRWGQAGCCSPCPYFCPHGCGYCGDVLYANRCCVMGPCNSCSLGIGHVSMVVWMWCFGCCVTDLICGMKPGEGAKVEQAINAAKANQASPVIRAPFNPASLTMAGMR